MTLLLSIENISDEMGELVGAKALSLSRLSRAGFRVPEGFVVTTAAFEALVAEAGLDELLRDLGQLTPDRLQEFRTRLLELEFPSELRDPFQDHYRSLSTDSPLAAVAVRSSGTKEDLSDASFAGQYDTFLNVLGAEATECAIRRCWASIAQQRVIEYAQRHGGGVQGLSMAVIVQRLVDAEVSGVLFSLNPITGSETQCVIEAVYGLGEALVSGHVSGDQYVAEMPSGRLLHTQVAQKLVRVVRANNGETREEPLSEEMASRPSLEATDIKQLTELAARIQRFYGQPMDVEWAYKQGHIYALQARPITKISFAEDLGEWTTADLRDGGVASSVCSPMMASLYKRSFDAAMGRYLRSIKLLKTSDRYEWMSQFYARPYWNLGATKEVMSRVPGFNERNFDMDLGIEPTYVGDGRVTKTTVLGVLRAVPVLLAMRRGFKACERANRAYRDQFDGRYQRFDLSAEELGSLSEDTFRSEFRVLIYEFYAETETRYFTTIYNVSNSKLELQPYFDAADRLSGGRLNFVNLAIGLRDLSHVRPLKDMYERLTALQAQGGSITDGFVEDFARTWKHHSRHELDLRVPHWDEDLVHVRDFLEQSWSAFDSKKDPISTEKEQYSRFLEERALALKAIGWRFWLKRGFWKNLNRFRAFLWWREEMRDHSTRVYYLLRKWLLVAGERLVSRGILADIEDVLYLEHSQLIAALEGSVDEDLTRKEATLGRWRVESFRNFKNPNEIGAGGGYQSGTSSQLPSSEEYLTGTGCAPGRVEGIARVVYQLEDVYRVQAGEILVTVFTDPGWTPVFARLGGVVTENGGLLAHAAVIARECGLPAVLSVQGATRRIKDGDHIIVDGKAGTVEWVRK